MNMWIAPVLIAATSVLAQEASEKPRFPTDIRVERAVAYLPPERTEKADLYFPSTMPAKTGLPAVLIIHGGGWTGGERDASREINIASTLARNGYVAMSIDYVLATKEKATWPQNLYDCKTAVRWLRKNADRLQIDPGRIGVIGGSAGGHLAAMVALTGPEDKLDPAEPYGEFSCRVQCGVDLYGPAELPEYRDVVFLGKTFAEAPELYRAASPTRYADKNDPPMLILHGTADKIVELKQSKILAEVLKKAGVESELVIVHGATHTFDLQPKQRDLRPLVLGFFDKHLKAAQAK